MIWLCTVQVGYTNRRLIQYVQAPTAQEASRQLRLAGLVEVGQPVQAA